MNARTTTLENGLTVVSHNMEHVETVSLGCVGQGWRP